MSTIQKNLSVDKIYYVNDAQIVVVDKIPLGFDTQIDVVDKIPLGFDAKKYKLFNPLKPRLPMV
jgi:hypothetical protein